MGKPKCNKCGFFGHLEKDCQGKGKGKKKKDGKRFEKSGSKKKKDDGESHNVEEEIACILQEDEEMYNYDSYDQADLNKIDERIRHNATGSSD